MNIEINYGCKIAKLIQSGVLCIVITIDNNNEHEIVTDCYWLKNGFPPKTHCEITSLAAQSANCHWNVNWFERCFEMMSRPKSFFVLPLMLETVLITHFCHMPQKFHCVVFDLCDKRKLYVLLNRCFKRNKVK